jgi:hypothetical protein
MKFPLLGLVEMGMVLSKDERKEATSREDQDPSRDLSGFERRNRE